MHFKKSPNILWLWILVSRKFDSYDVKVCVKRNKPYMSKAICWLCWKLQCWFDISTSSTTTNQKHPKETRISNSCKKNFNDVENTRKVSNVTVALHKSTELFWRKIVWKWTVNHSYEVEPGERIFSDSLLNKTATTFTTFPMEYLTYFSRMHTISIQISISDGKWQTPKDLNEM